MTESSQAEANEVCVVDDDPSVLKSIHYLLASEGFKVRPFNKAEDFLAHAGTHHVPIVVTDIWMDEVTGLELLARLCAISPRTKVIVITAREDLAARATAMAIGPVAFFMLPLLTGQTKESPRKEFYYFNDDSDLVGLRYDNWKFVFAEQRAKGTLLIWEEPFTPLRFPKLFNLRTDPYEKADVTSNTYYDWWFDHAYICVPAQAIVGEFLATFKDFPPSQKAGSFSVDQVLEKLKAGAAAK